MSGQLSITDISKYGKNDTALIGAACFYRRLFFLNNVPPSRYSPVNPYPQYTKEQLDMRRKCEIFKYAGSSCQSNTLSKKAQYAYLANSTSNNAAKSTQYNCSQDRLIPTPTSACDVPGPVRMLTYDPTIVLYNYGQRDNERSYPDAANDLMSLGAGTSDDT